MALYQDSQNHLNKIDPSNPVINPGIDQPAGTNQSIYPMGIPWPGYTTLPFKILNMKTALINLQLKPYFCVPPMAFGEKPTIYELQKS